MDFETLNIEVTGPIARLTLNRPECLNAMNAIMLRELAEAARWFDSQRDVRVVIVSGAGRAFSAGADLKDSSRSEADGWLALRGATQAGSRMMDAVESMKATTIAERSRPRGGRSGVARSRVRFASRRGGRPLFDTRSRTRNPTGLGRNPSVGARDWAGDDQRTGDHLPRVHASRGQIHGFCESGCPRERTRTTHNGPCQ